MKIKETLTNKNSYLLIYSKISITEMRYKTDFSVHIVNEMKPEHLQKIIHLSKLITISQATNHNKVVYSSEIVM